ncbi:MAG: peptidase M16 [Candidatus Mesenet longicola]|uniref:Peptidase M16 n=1 Tax=Candidatus Mesenet longicola TaxID=1892558 RepID=A0A8J3HP12_9RICK|nr:MAG: peptidase M16 [Candidatus Mesenet longicola]GHM59424.1 MAG: peptidase M16 [Candidatus Mesenet longicola]
MIRKLFIFLSFFIISQSAFALDARINHEKLENGMEIYIIPNHRIPAVMHMVWYKVGGADDPTGKSGLAHYLEHLMFKGTKKFEDVSATIGGIGGQFNAGTSADFTVYYELVQKKDLSLVMEVEADRMRNLNITDEAAEKERNIVLEERKMRIDNSPRAILREEMERAFYRSNYGRPVAGWENEINSFNKDDALSFYNKYYYPNNAILVIVGDVDTDEVLNLTKKHYGSIEFGPVAKRFPGSEPEHNANIAATLDSDEVQEPELFVWYKVPSKVTGKNYLKVSLIADILGGGMSSKLYEDLVLNKNLAVSVSVDYDEMVYNDSAIKISILPKSGVQIQEIENALNESIADFISKGISDKELQSTKYRYKANKIYDLDDLTSIAYFYGSNLILGIPIENIDITYKELDNLSEDEINSEISSIFTKAKLIGYLLPKGDENNVQ